MYNKITLTYLKTLLITTIKLVNIDKNNAYSSVSTFLGLSQNNVFVSPDGSLKIKDSEPKNSGKQDFRKE